MLGDEEGGVLSSSAPLMGDVRRMNVPKPHHRLLQPSCEMAVRPPPAPASLPASSGPSVHPSDTTGGNGQWLKVPGFVLCQRMEQTILAPPLLPRQCGSLLLHTALHGRAGGQSGFEEAIPFSN